MNDEQIQKLYNQLQIAEKSKPTQNAVNDSEKPIQQGAGDLVEQAFNQAVIATVTNDEKVQSDIMHGAEKVIQNKTSKIKAEAELEAKEAHFNNKKGACECFGFNETTTPKWAVNIMGFWVGVLTAIWILIGMVTFAPVTFVAKKVSVIFRKTWLAVLVALVIYIVFLLSPLWLPILKIGG